MRDSNEINKRLVLYRVSLGQRFPGRGLMGFHILRLGELRDQSDFKLRIAGILIPELSSDFLPTSMLTDGMEIPGVSMAKCNNGLHPIQGIVSCKPPREDVVGQNVSWDTLQTHLRTPREPRMN